jgi:hypothetical protein
MCKDSRILSRIHPHRFIAHCGCCGGIVHLAWGSLTLALSPQDFWQLHDFLTLHPQPPVSEGEGFLQASTAAEGPAAEPARLWIGDVGLRLGRLEWGELRHLCCLAGQELQRLEPQPKVPAALERLLN